MFKHINKYGRGKIEVWFFLQQDKGWTSRSVDLLPQQYCGVQKSAKVWMLTKIVSCKTEIETMGLDEQ